MGRLWGKAGFISPPLVGRVRVGADDAAKNKMPASAGMTNPEVLACARMANVASLRACPAISDLSHQKHELLRQVLRPETRV